MTSTEHVWRYVIHLLLAFRKCNLYFFSFSLSLSLSLSLSRQRYVIFFLLIVYLQYLVEQKNNSSVCRRGKTTQQKVSWNSTDIMPRRPSTLYFKPEKKYTKNTYMRYLRAV